MGIQDRDYYWEKHKEAAKSNVSDFESLLKRKKNRYQKPKKGSGRLRYLLMPTLMICALWYGANKFMVKFETTLIPGGVVLQADRSGHFKGTVLINGVAMPFMIDTGATITTIPTKMAQKAGLPFGMPVQSKTAGGIVEDHTTRIDNLKIGNAEITNLNASINQHIDHVLIGMNTLKYFHMTQSENRLTLVTNNRPTTKAAQVETSESISDQDTATLIPANNQPMIRRVPVVPSSSIQSQETLASNQPIKKPVMIKKTVSCDSRQICTTKYSDR